MEKSTLISKGLLGASCALSVLGVSLGVNAAGTPVDIELVFAIDASESITEKSFYEHINALNNIFNDQYFYEDFVSELGQHHSLAVSVYQFGTQTNSRGINIPVIDRIADWTVFNESHQSGIPQLQSNTIKKIGGMTPIGNAINVVMNDLLNNSYDGHTVINLSTDGFNTSSTINPVQSSTNAFLNGVTINVLAMAADSTLLESAQISAVNAPYNLPLLNTIVDRYPGIPNEYKNKNFDGDSAFVMLDYARGDKTLEEALRLKIAEETIGSLPADRNTNNNPQSIPEPSSLLGLLSISILGLLGQRKKV